MPKQDLSDGFFCFKNLTYKLKTRRGAENMVADHLSRLTIAHDTHSPPINDEFPEESLMQLEKAPWYAHIVNSSQQEKSHLIGKNRIGSISLRRSIPIIGKSPSCLNTVQIR